MPRVNIYIRVKDWQKWQSIADKPSWLHLALEGTDVPTVNRAIQERKKIEKIMKPMMKNKAISGSYIKALRYERSQLDANKN